jgi:uncharacterized SAM-binding protein YcdF (DUF218 family)
LVALVDRDMVTILSTLILPSGLSYFLFGLGLLAVAFKRTRAASWWLLASSGAIHVVFSIGAVAAALMSPLDYAHRAVQDPKQFPEAEHIVVLTGWAGDDPEMPLTGQLSPAAAYRVLHALELYSERPDCDVIVSGEETTAHIMAKVLRKLGVPAGRLRIEDDSPTTADSATHLRQLVGSDPFFLVTSAGHLVRALGAIERGGLNAIPAPTDHQLPKDWRRAELTPSPFSLVVSDRAMHEYAGILWYRLRGRA